MNGFFALVYSSAVYLFFLATFVYTIGFVSGFPGVKTLDSGATGDVATAVLIDALLLALFAVQHSVMARRGFKAWWARIVPVSVERSTYVLAATLAVALLVWQWRPIAGEVWSVEGSARVVLIALGGLGWATLLVATFLLNHFELFGLKQAYDRWRGYSVGPATFRTPALYRLVRHPIYLGFIIGFWATPHMSYGHLLFAIMATGYIFVGTYFEERDLIAQFGDQYRRYKAEVGMLVPWPRARDARQARAVQRPPS